MQFTNEDVPEGRLPEDSIHTARLESIELRNFEWTDRKTGELKQGQSLDWWWVITRTNYGDQYIGRRLKSECNARLTNRSDNYFRKWAEALRKKPIEVGESLDTDQLLGLEAEIVIAYRKDRNDPTKSWAFVSDVGEAAEGGQSFDPPF